VLAAYTCGEGRVLRVIRTQNINYLDNFWDLYQRLPRETPVMFPRFIATLHIVKNPELYGLNDIELDPELVWDEIEIDRQAHLRDIAKVLDLDTSRLELFNPELSFHILPPEPYMLRVPHGTADKLLAQLDNIPTASLPERARTTQITHTVRPGETLGGIARRYRTSVNNIMRANNLRNTTIRAGARLRIPVTTSTTSASAPAAPRRPGGSGTSIHVVSRGDTLYGIAKRYQTTIAQITTLNNLSSTQVQVGQRLRIPGQGERLGTYSVQKGDTPAAIARNITCRWIVF
jgi:membrane-bound lytic murein transglycosylase D